VYFPSTYFTQTSILSAIKIISSGAFQPFHFCYAEKSVIGWKTLFSSRFDQFVVYGASHAIFI